LRGGPLAIGTPTRFIGAGVALATLFGAGCASEERTRPAPIVDAEPVTIAIAPSEAELDPPKRSFAREGGTTSVQFTALGGFDDLSVRDVTNEVTWESTRPDVVAIDARGLATALSSGSAAITATLRGAWDSAPVTVLEAPRTGPPPD
jgi:hypothetical protein